MGTQACPMCAEEIQADAGICQFCGTTFAVTRSGYCSSCHQVVSAAEDLLCPACAGSLLDVRTQRTMLEPPPVPAWAAAAAVATPAPATPPWATPAPSPGAPWAAPAPDAADAPVAATDTIHLWQPLLPRMIAGTLLNAAALLGLIVAVWGSDWAEQRGDLVFKTWRGPYLLPVIVLVAVQLLLWRGGNNQRPRGARRLTTREWRQKWRQNRKDFGVRGAFKPVPGGAVRVILAALVWAGVAVVVLVNVQHLQAMDGVEVSAAPWAALATVAVGALGCLLCLPVSHRRLVKVDSDGDYYGTVGET